MHLPLDSDTLAALADSSARVAIVDTPALHFGVKTFEPGEVFANHFHAEYDEFFVGLEGEVTIWQGRNARLRLAPGTSLLCRRGSHHYLENEGTQPARLAFLKVPQVDGDTVWVPWTPPPRSER